MSDCIEWQGKKDVNGYGVVRLKAHRLAYERTYGVIPDGLCIMHKCDNPGCVNPEHLMAGTISDNVIDMVRKGRSGRAKLTEELAVYAMARLLCGETQQSVADAFGVKQITISNIWTGSTWRHCFA